MSVAPNVAPQETIDVSTTRRLQWPVAWVVAGILAAVVVALTLYEFKETTKGARTEVTNGQQPTPQQTTQASTKSKSAPPAPVKLSPGDIASKYSDAVVVLDNYNNQGQRMLQGSGFIFSSDGRVLTNYHVIRGASRIVARMHDQTMRDADYIVGLDTAHDIAVLKLYGDGLPSVHLGNSSVVKVGDHVTLLGAPLGLESTLSDGIISAVRESAAFRVFQTSAPISHGSSGGPMFDDYGNVVGLAVATIEAGENLNFAVPIESTKALLTGEHQTSFAELLSTTAVRQPILASSVSIPPQVMTYAIVVPPQGGSLVGSFSIAGGLGNDLGMVLASDNGAIVWNGGIVKKSGYVEYSPPRWPLQVGSE
jgi:hypothetical protein